MKKLRIQVSSFTIKKDLIDHPEYPNMLAMSDCLTSWKIPNGAFLVEKDLKKIESLTFPFIAHLNVSGGKYIVVDAISNGYISFSNEIERNGSLKIDDFLKMWDGVILFAEKGEFSREVNYTQSLIKGFIINISPFFLPCVLILIIILRLNLLHTTQAFLFLIIVKIFGLILSGFLSMHSLNSNNTFINKLCRLGNKSDCDKILKSKAAKLTNWLTWSEVGLFYFSSSLLLLLVIPSSLELMNWYTILCLPYTIYSIAYQLKVKNWCTACCLVQVVLWLEASIFYFGNIFFKYSFPFTFELLPIIVCILLPIAAWIFIKPYFINAFQVEPLKEQLKKFKYNKELFSQFMMAQKKYSTVDNIRPIILGNPEAETVITVISNPFCDPCRITHQFIDKWINERNDIQVKLLFVISGDDDEGTMFAKHMNALQAHHGNEIVMKALNDWYNRKSKRYVFLSDNYPVTFNNEINITMKYQKEWMDRASIAYTPTILIDGYELVSPYKLEDVKYLILT
ncbi:vitamin K epoxide reductase family protein [Pedobacter sp. MR2016-24]|uniref:vitamin K epoxide reductase family protein n=1 Tax=Pedobacter sp. MR2016-24 TaxID=2994466 RepID=UPI002245A4B4|nr:cysteine peptidase family C39 domain-containing protein [Pedobacter sp. MR2016-24]MCX2485013.1 cysteine peptidase family C39 domain-containing protein [Pedobacter sp. MR2016-24]